MGKRELLLIVAFLIVGAVVYQATAPPAGPNERSLSISGILAKVRREMRGDRARAETNKISTHEIDATVTEVRLAGGFVEVTVTGEKRNNIEARLRVTSTGYDEAEAKQLAGETHLKAERMGTSLRLASRYPDPGQQRAFLTLLVPARMNVRIEQGSGGQRNTITHVSSVEAAVRGEVSIRNIAGRVTLTHRGGRAAVDGVAAIKLTGRGSDATVANVRGDASFSMHSGELTGTSIAGPIEVESQNAEIVLKHLGGGGGPVRVNATGGSVALEGVGRDTRVEGRNTEIDVVMSKAAPLTVSNEGGEPIEITTPPGGFVLDVRVTNARLSLPDEIRSQLSSTGGAEEQEQRATGPVRGGGPTITLRANHGDITVRPDATTAPER